MGNIVVEKMDNVKINVVEKMDNVKNEESYKINVFRGSVPLLP